MTTLVSWFANVLTALAAVVFVFLSLGMFLDHGRVRSPEGNWAHILFALPAWLMLLVPLCAAVARRGFAWTGTPIEVQWLIGLGMGAALAFGSIDLLGRQELGWQTLGGLIPLAFAGYLFLLMNPSLRDNAPGWLLRVPGIGLGVVALVYAGIFLMLEVRKAQYQAASAAEGTARAEAMDQEQYAFERGEYAKIPKDAQLWQYMGLLNCRDKELEKKVRTEIAQRPNLDTELVELLGNGWADYAAEFIAESHPHPGPALAESYAAHMRKSIEKWKSGFRPGDALGGYSLNIESSVLGGAEKISAAGGDLKAPAREWAVFLTDYKGTASLKRRFEKIAK